jgi:hypothetical protein
MSLFRRKPTRRCAATGSSLSYQWLWNGIVLTNVAHMLGAANASISGATSNTLTIGNIFATITSLRGSTLDT